MGRAFYETSARAKAVFEEANAALGADLTRVIFEGPEADLALTANTQPAVLTVSVAAAAACAERGLQPALAAGHSLGEYSALVVAGALGLRRRGADRAPARPVHAGGRSRGDRGHGRHDGPGPRRRGGALRGGRPGRGGAGGQRQLGGPDRGRRPPERGGARGGPRRAPGRSGEERHAPGERALPLRPHGPGGRATGPGPGRRRGRRAQAARRPQRRRWRDADGGRGEAVPAAPGGQPRALDRLCDPPGRARAPPPSWRSGLGASCPAWSSESSTARRRWPWRIRPSLDKALAALGSAR